MPIANVVDHRTYTFKVECDVMFEPCFNDNSCEEASQFPPIEDTYWVEGKNETTIAQAIEWARQIDFPITMFVYDAGSLNSDAGDLD